MRKTFLKVSFLAALGVAMSASFTSCKDYDDDFKRVDSEIAAIQESVKKIQDLVSSGSVITNVTQNGAGVTFTLSNGQSYTVTNGKDGVNGKDADVWTIEKNAEGVWYWAKNGELTDVPAQGPKGEQGEAGKPGDGLPGNYYVPNEETGCFDLYDGKTNELIEATDIRWKPADEEQIAAVDCGDYVVITGLKGYDQPLKIWKSSYIKSLVVKPELYLDGIESVRYGVLEGWEMKTLYAQAAIPVSEPNQVAGTTASIAKGQPYDTDWKLNADNKTIWYAVPEIATIKYAVNPSNAAISKVNWTLAFDDIEVVNRSSYITGEVLDKPAIDKNGDITLTYVLNDADSYLAPNYWMLDYDIDKTNQWTFMALKAQVNDQDSLVTSDNVAVLKEAYRINNLVVDANTNLRTSCAAAWTAEDAIQTAYAEPTTSTPVLQIPYNQLYQLADHIGVDVNISTPMIDGGYWQNNGTAENPDMQWIPYGPNAAQDDEVNYNKNNYVVSLAQLVKQFNLVPSFQLVTYTVGSQSTSENRFASINAQTGVVTPMYVNSNGESVSGVGAEGGIARSSIGRRPLVYVTLSNKDGQLLTAGFVKLEISEPEIVFPNIVLDDIRVPYICNYYNGSTWDQISGKVYEVLGITPKEFSDNYEMETGTAYIESDGQMINTTNNPNWYKACVNYGSFNWLGDGTGATNPDGSFTQGLVFHITKNQYLTWYGGKWTNNNTHWVTAAENYSYLTSEPFTKTLYAKFTSKNYNSTVYIGFNVTVVGAPAANYKGQLFSSWSQNYTVTPVNPAVPGQTMTGIYGNTGNKYNYAQVMGMNFTSAWQGGDPTVKDSDPAYIWATSGITIDGTPWGNNSVFAVDRITANYRFAADQDDYTGRSKAKYAIRRNGKIGTANDVHALYAYKYDNNGNVDVTKNGQPIAVINANDAIRYEIGGNAGTLGSTSNAGGVWNRIDFLSVYGNGTNGEVIAPSNGTAPVGGWNYGAFACDIINAEAYDFDNPPITFNVEMVVKYTQNPKGLTEATTPCELVIPGYAEYMAGAGRPLSIADDKKAGLQDAKNGQILASQLFGVVDWQGHKLWNVNSKGVVSKSEFNGVTLGDYWMSTGSYSNVEWGTGMTSSFVIDLQNATVGPNADGSGLLGKFVDIYTDKHVLFTPTTASSPVVLTNNNLVATVNNWADLDDVYVSWVNNGNSVTNNIYIFVPVYINYIWGQKILLGQATLTIQPTLQGN